MILEDNSSGTLMVSLIAKQGSFDFKEELKKQGFKFSNDGMGAQWTLEPVNRNLAMMILNKFKQDRIAFELIDYEAGKPKSEREFNPRRDGLNMLISGYQAYLNDDDDDDDDEDED